MEYGVISGSGPFQANICQQSVDNGVADRRKMRTGVYILLSVRLDIKRQNRRDCSYRADFEILDNPKLILCLYCACISDSIRRKQMW